MDGRGRAAGVAALAFSGFLFGSTFVVVQDAVERAEVLPFLAVRFLFGAAVLAPLAFRRPSSPGVARHGVVAGVSLLVGYLLQTVGLQHTTPATSAFITYLLVVLVPVIVALRSRTLPTSNVTIGVVLAVAGLLALVGGVNEFGRGEVLTLGCALAFAVHLLIVGEVADRHDAFRFTFWQVVTVGVICLVPGAFAGAGPGAGYSFDGRVWLAALFCGVGPTAIAFWGMSWGQRVVPESQAAIVLLLEPVSAAVIGSFTGDSLGPRQVLGATLILAAVLVSELGARRVGAVGAEMAVATADGD